jgi:anaphase-promoting complex subunit 2
LRAAQAIYLYELKSYLLISQGDVSPRKTLRRSKKKGDTIKQMDNNDPRIRAFLRSLNSVISYSLPDPQWSELVYAVFLELCGIAVGLSVEEDATSQDDDTVTMASDEATELDDALYDEMPQSFKTETDLDGDSILVASDEGDIIIPAEMDGMDDFDQYKQQPKGPKADARRKVLQLWEDMEKLGIGGGGRRGERVFAEVINTLITMYIHESFAERWESPSVAGSELDEWVENVLGRLIVDVLFSSTVQDQGGDARLDKLSPRESLRVCRESLDKRRRGGMDIDHGAGAGEEESKRRKEDLESWKKIAVGRLGRLRVSELFDIVVDWPGSLGGVEDLKVKYPSGSVLFLFHI